MRILTFMSLGETKSEVQFEDLCKELNFGLDEVEAFVIEGTKTSTVIYAGQYKELCKLTVMSCLLNYYW